MIPNGSDITVCLLKTRGLRVSRFGLSRVGFDIGFLALGESNPVLMVLKVVLDPLLQFPSSGASREAQWAFAGILLGRY